MVQLDPGELELDVALLQLPGMVITSLKTNRSLSLEGTFHRGWTSFVLSPNRVQTEPANWCGVDVDANTLSISHPVREHYYRLPAHWHDIQIMVTDDLLRNADIASDALLDQALVPQHAHLPLSAPHARRLTRQLHELLTPAAADPIGAQCDQQITALREQLIEELARAIEVGEINRNAAGPLQSTRHSHLVMDVMASVRNQIDLPATAEQLCEDMGLNQWRVQRSFRKVLGISPYQYLLRVRLNRARSDLLRDSHSARITDIATTHGFASASEFSRHYKRFFGESPSSTLR